MNIDDLSLSVLFTTIQKLTCSEVGHIQALLPALEVGNSSISSCFYGSTPGAYHEPGCLSQVVEQSLLAEIRGQMSPTDERFLERMCLRRLSKPREVV